MSRSYKKVSTCGFACDNHGETQKYYTMKRRTERRTRSAIEIDPDEEYLPNMVTTSHQKHSRKTIHNAYDEPTDGSWYWWHDKNGNTSGGDKKHDLYYINKRK